MSRVHSLQVPELCHNLGGRGADARCLRSVRGLSQKVEERCNAFGCRSDESQGEAAAIVRESID